MASLAQRRPSSSADIWPGFVDALASLLMVIIFLLTVFVLAQFFLSDLLAGRDQALARLEAQVSELAEMLALERQAGEELRGSVASLSLELQGSTAERDRLTARVSELAAALGAAQSEKAELAERAGDLNRELAAERARLAEARTALAAREKRLGEIEARLGKSQAALADEQRISAARRSEVERLTVAITSLRAELARLNAALEASEAKVAEQNTRIVNLGKRLNAALARRVEELARYRSEFFGRLREVLGNRRDIRIVGDRFVFQSEVLFDSATATLGAGGKEQIKRLAATLVELSPRIPKGIDWVLRVDGHTDVRPIKTAEFPSNWELSTARALSVVRELVAAGVPPARLAPTGFGPYQPIDPRQTDAAYRRNRRIEFKLTER